MLFFLLFCFELFLLSLLSKNAVNGLFNLFLRIFGSARLSTWLIGIIFLPGTFIHELAHLLVAWVLFVPAGKLELMPVLGERGIKLGSVQIHQTDIFRRTLIGVAPLIVGVTLLLTILMFTAGEVKRGNFLGFLLGSIFVYAVFVISNTMFSSKKDLEGLVWVLALVALIIGLVFLFWGGYPFSILAQFLDGNQSFFKFVSLFLLVPLGLNFLVMQVRRI